MEVQTMNDSATLVDLIDRILDKGLVINADISVSLVGVELLGVKIRASLASFETAAKWGLEFPGGTKKDTEAWKKANVPKQECPNCGKRVPEGELMEHGCPWCGWKSAKFNQESEKAGALNEKITDENEETKDGY
jgi:predicted RNA-binding Zn-ribbon protein involved in translation (DUF1610 family)